MIIFNYIFGWVMQINLYMVENPVKGFFISLFLFVFFYSYITIKNHGKYNDFLTISSGIILIGGLFGKGKTFLLTTIAKLFSDKEDFFVCSNFVNNYDHVKYSSIDDFCRLLNDLVSLADYQNFDISEKIEIKKQFPGYFKTSNSEFKKKYKYIPCNGHHCNIILLGDEFHKYFYARLAYGNFKGQQGQILLDTIHELRHHNVLAILSTQVPYDLDKSFRTLCEYLILATKKKFWTNYNFYYFLPEEENKEKMEKMKKTPYTVINYYNINIIINKIDKNLMKLIKYFIGKYNKFFKKNFFLKKERIIKKFDVLKFKSKANVKINIDVYKEGDILKIINEYYKKSFDK